jgi:hypothetical protein
LGFAAEEEEVGMAKSNLDKDDQKGRGREKEQGREGGREGGGRRRESEEESHGRGREG